MNFRILTVDCDISPQIVKCLHEYYRSDFEIQSSTSNLLELIELVDENIDLIKIRGTSQQELEKQLYFFREFNQLLEDIPILIQTDFSIFSAIQSKMLFGFIDYIAFDENYNTTLQRFIHCLTYLTRTEKLRSENIKYRTKLFDNYKQLEYQKKRSEELLKNILPEETARELIIHGFAKPQKYRKVSVLFTDFVNFTKICEVLTPEEILSDLDSYFSKFDEIIETHYCEKIKTIGDAYMCAGGVPIRNNSNPIDMILVGFEMQEYMYLRNIKNQAEGKHLWYLRIGINTGPVMTGVIGKKKFAYDLWGDTVNVASRIEASGEMGKVNISESTYIYVKKYFNCIPRGKIYAKNKGDIEMYFVEGLKDEFRIDNNPFKPNKLFFRELARL